MIDQIQWLGHGSFLIKGPPIIYIAPWRVVRSAFHADVILVGHTHYDHFSAADIEKLRGPHTQIIGNEHIVQQMPESILLRPWQSITIDNASIKAIPAYSENDIQHPKSAGGLGFLVSLNTYDIYYAGDTGITPEMDRIQPDIAILPIDGHGTLTVDDAVEVVKKMRPRWVLPSNWGAAGEGATLHDAQQFKERVGERAQVILPPNSNTN